MDFLRKGNTLRQALLRANAALNDFTLMTFEGMAVKKLRPCGHCHDGYSVAKVLNMSATSLLYDDRALCLNDYLCDYVKIPPDADAVGMT